MRSTRSARLELFKRGQQLERSLPFLAELSKSHLDPLGVGAVSDDSGSMAGNILNHEQGRAQAQDPRVLAFNTDPSFGFLFKAEVRNPKKNTIET